MCVRLSAPVNSRSLYQTWIKAVVKWGRATWTEVSFLSSFASMWKEREGKKVRVKVPFFSLSRSSLVYGRHPEASTRRGKRYHMYVGNWDRWGYNREKILVMPTKSRWIVRERIPTKKHRITTPKNPTCITILLCNVKRDPGIDLFTGNKFSTFFLWSRRQLSAKGEGKRR